MKCVFPKSYFSRGGAKPNGVIVEIQRLVRSKQRFRAFLQLLRHARRRHVKSGPGRARIVPSHWFSAGEDAHKNRTAAPDTNEHRTRTASITIGGRVSSAGREARSGPVWYLAEDGGLRDVVVIAAIFLFSARFFPPLRLAPRPATRRWPGTTLKTLTCPRSRRARPRSTPAEHTRLAATELIMLSCVYARTRSRGYNISLLVRGVCACVRSAMRVRGRHRGINRIHLRFERFNVRVTSFSLDENNTAHTHTRTPSFIFFHLARLSYIIVNYGLGYWYSLFLSLCVCSLRTLSVNVYGKRSRRRVRRIRPFQSSAANTIRYVTRADACVRFYHDDRVVKPHTFGTILRRTNFPRCAQSRVNDDQ